MKRNPDHACLSCGNLIIDRAYPSALYCQGCYGEHRLEYRRQFMKDYYYLQKTKAEESLERIIALSVMFSKTN